MIFNVKGQSLELDGGNVIAEGAVEFACFTLECDSSWDSFSKTVRFRHVSQEETYDVAGVVDGKVYYIPAEVLVRGSVFVSVLGVSGSTRISTTELAGFFVEGTVDSGKTPSVTENAYAQYVDMVSGKCEGARESADTAKSFRDEAEMFAAAASTSEERAKKSAEACMEYTAFCRKVSGEVSGAELSMNAALEGVRNSVETLLSHDHSLSVAENERVAGENSRAENERLRKVAESERAQAENGRVNAENERVAAERGRVAGENERNARLLETENKVKSIADSLHFTAGAITGELQSQNVAVDDAVSKPPLKFGISGKTKQDGTPDRNNPMAIESAGESGTVSVKHHGKNFIVFPYYYKNPKYNNGIWFDPLDDGGVLVYGQTEDVKALNLLSVPEQKLSPGRYVVSGSTKECGVYVYDNTQLKYIALSRGGEAVFDVENETNIEVRIYINPNTTVNETVLYPMIRYFGTDDSYVRWEEKEYSVSVPCTLNSVDGVCDILTLVDYGATSRLEKKVQRYKADGAEEVTLVSNAGEYNIFTVIRGDGKIAETRNDYDGMGFCNYLPYTNSADGECCWNADGEIFLKLSAGEFPDTAAVSAFLSKCHADGVPFETVYVLEDVEISDYLWDDSITLLNPVNVMNTDSGEIFLEYIKDTNTVYESIIDTLISLDARVSLLEV